MRVSQKSATYCLTLALVISLLGVCPAFAEIYSNSLVRRGLEAFNRGNGSEARQQYLLAARLGNPIAWHNLGGVYLEGIGEIQADPAKAFRYYHVASLLGFANSQYQLATMMEMGKGTYQEPVEALKWYMLADNQGYQLAKDRISQVLGDIPPEIVREAQQRVEAFTPLPYQELLPLLYVHKHLRSPAEVTINGRFNTGFLFNILDPRTTDDVLRVKYGYAVFAGTEMVLVSDVETMEINNGQTSALILEGLQAGRRPGNYLIRFGLQCNDWNWSVAQPLDVVDRP